MHVTPTQLDAATCSRFGARPFDYQLQWNTGARTKNRVLTKMRQPGADWFFALEALNDALVTGRNQIFLGTSADYAMNAKAYMTAFVDHAAPRVKHDEIVVHKHHLELANGAAIHFIGPKSPAASLHGNVYASEFAWAESPKDLIAIAKRLSMHSRYHSTFYTTPSHNPEAWRTYQSLTASKQTTSMLFTAEDARQSGASLFADDWLETMQRELTAEEWQMLFMCEWPQADKELAA